MAGSQSLKESIAGAPRLPGVYSFLDVDGRVLYIGKAKSLRNRLQGHLSTPGDSRHTLILEKAVSVEWIITGSEVDALPLGAIGIYNVADKIKVGLQQLMAGSRSWGVEHIGREDIFALTKECAEITGIPYVMDAYREQALEIIDA